MKKMNNKGFSLVELIVVIAIMGVLMVVLAPQYLKFVEKSRLQKDNSAIAEIANTMKIALSDEAIAKEVQGKLKTAAGSVKVTLTTSAGDWNTGSDLLNAELKSTISEKTYALSSGTYSSASSNPTLTVTCTNGVFTIDGSNIIESQNGSAGSRTF